MSHLLGVLRAGDQTTPLAPAPGLPEIAGLVAQAREAGMRVAQTVHGAARPVPGGLSLAAYRIVQEALTNVRKHAGPGATTRVTLRYGTGELVVRVEDDGGPLAAPDRLPRYGAAARPPAAPGHGLAEMRERAAIYGGTVRADSRRDGGFEVTARLPLPVVAPDEDRQPAGRQPRGWPSRGAA